MLVQIWLGELSQPPIQAKFDFLASDSLYFSTTEQVDFGTVKRIVLGKQIKKVRLEVKVGGDTHEEAVLDQAIIFSSSQNNFERLSSGKHKYSHSPLKPTEKEI